MLREHLLHCLIALKQLLLDHRVVFEDRMMIGQLLKTIRDANVPKYVDPSLREVGEIINRSRAGLVIRAERDLNLRALDHKLEGVIGCEFR